MQDKRLAWEDMEGKWALVSDWSHEGMSAECGIIASWHRIAFSAGISTISFRTVTFTCGIGARF